MTYAILGATGNTGGAAARHLLKRGATVRAVTRDAARAEALRAAGAEVRAASIDDADALAAALSGVEGVYLLIPPPLTAPDFLVEARRIGAAIAAAVERARPPHVVVLSSVGAQEPRGAIASLATFERQVAATGVDRTILRPGYFLSNWGGVAPLAKDAGILPTLLQPVDRGLPTLSTDDIGAAAAEALLSPAKGERIVNLAGPKDYSPADVAAAFSAALGKPVQPVTPPEAEWPGILVQAGLSQSYADALAEMYREINAGRLGFPPGEPVTRGRTTLDEAVRALV
jgi:NAD(P)H dehydrogenase (quinone)